MDYEPYEIDGDNRIVPLHSQGWAKNQPTKATTFDDALEFFLKPGLDDAGLVGPNRQELVESLIQDLSAFRKKRYLNPEEALYLLTGVMLENASYRFEWEGQIFFVMRPDFGLKCILQNFNAAPVNDYESKLRDELLRFSEEVEAIYLAIKHGEILASDALGKRHSEAPLDEWLVLFQKRGFDLSHIPGEFFVEGSINQGINDYLFMERRLEEANEQILQLKKENDELLKKINADPRQINSLLKMVIAMAIRGYTFDPDAKQNSAVAEIAADVDLVGLSIDPDTVRRWLRRGREMLPSDWRCSD